MNTKKYNVLGMSCEGCQKKISSALNNVKGIKADVNLAGNFVEISSEQEIDLEKLNTELKNAGNYVLEDPEKPKSTEFIPPQDRVSPSSVYYCPMECEGDKVYFVQGKRCPVCNMYCVPIEEKEETAGGFILAGASQDKTKKAQVLAVGEGIRSLNGDLIAPSVTEGETVLVDALAGVPVKEDGQDLLIIREADVLAIVK